MAKRTVQRISIPKVYLRSNPPSVIGVGGALGFGEAAAATSLTHPLDFMDFRKSLKFGCSIATPNQWISLIFMKSKGGMGIGRRPAGRPGSGFGPKSAFSGQKRDPERVQKGDPKRVPKWATFWSWKMSKKCTFWPKSASPALGCRPAVGHVPPWIS